jgi:hypothetical protein
MIEAWWRSLKHQWLFLHSLDSVTTIRRLVAFYVDEHNRLLPHSAFRGQTPDEMYYGTADTVPTDLTSGAAASHDGPALRPTDQRPARHVRLSTQLHDPRMTDGPCDHELRGPMSRSAISRPIPLVPPMIHASLFI